MFSLVCSLVLKFSAIDKWTVIEGFWKSLKADVVNNVIFEKFYLIKIAVHSFMERVNTNPQETNDRLLVRM